MGAHNNYFRDFVKGLLIVPADSGPNPVTDVTSITKEGAILIYSNALRIYLNASKCKSRKLGREMWVSGWKHISS